VAPDLGLIAHTAQGDPHKLASQRFGDALSQGGLAGAGRANKAQDRAFDLGRRDLAHRDVLQDTLLGPGQAVVLAVEHPRGMGQIEVVLTGSLPGQADQPVQVRPDHADFRRHRREHTQPV